MLTIPFDDALDLGSLFFTWESAVPVAGSVLGANAFDQPNVSEAKDSAADVLAAYARERRFPIEEPDAADGELGVHGAPGAATVRRRSPTSSVRPSRHRTSRSWPTRRERRRRPRPRPPANGHPRRAAWPPRSATARAAELDRPAPQGRPPTGVFLQVTTQGHDDLGVPGSAYRFHTLIQAQALGDRRALRSRGLPVLRVHVGGDPGAGLMRLAELVDEALSAAAG